jgi:hypothetical protein
MKQYQPERLQSNLIFKTYLLIYFQKLLIELLENDIVSITDFKDEKFLLYGLRNAAEASGCKSGYLFSIKSIEGKFIGTLGIDYTKRKTKLDPRSY